LSGFGGVLMGAHDGGVDLGVHAMSSSSSAGAMTWAFIRARVRSAAHRVNR
jgi:hypothetical protein